MRIESPTTPYGENHLKESELNETPVASREPTAAESPSPAAIGRVTMPPPMKKLAVLAAGLIVCFSIPLYDLFRFSVHSDLYSHLFLIPFVSAYVAWTQRSRWISAFKPAFGPALALAGLGVGLVAAFWIAAYSGSAPERQDRLSLLTLAFVSFFAAGCALLLGSRNFRAQLFPILFLLFMVPLPLPFERGVESFLQHASADSAYALISLSGMPILREGTAFKLPGFSMNVAPECSGIHSTLVLFITALVAGQFFFRNRWTRTALVVGVVALGILRNAVRIFTLAQLCVRVDPNIINSQLHRNGGPIFFAVSLIPFFVLIWILRRLELRRKPKN